MKRTPRRPPVSEPDPAGVRREIPIGFYPETLRDAERIRALLRGSGRGRVTLADVVRYALRFTADDLT